MAHEWKPGDVALLQAGTTSERIGLRTEGGWRTVRGLMTDETTPAGAIHRPLVVIDPEDESEAGVSRLCDLIRKHHRSSEVRVGIDWLSVQAALREFAAPTPPKPEEPTDPAVRVWANGSEWAKCGSWWVTPAVNEVPREWDYLVESVGFEVQS